MAQQTALAAAIATVGATSLTVDDYLGFPASGEYTIYIDTEALRVTAGQGTTTWTVTRGYLGTTAATHLDNATVTLLVDSVITLATAKTWVSISDTIDDGWLASAVDATNRAVHRGVGVDLGPSADTTRTYALQRANGKRLTTGSETRRTIPGGIRAFTTVDVSIDGTTWVDVTADVAIGPESFERAYGEPGAFIEFRPYTATAGSFAGYNYLKVTGTAFATFGWDAYPDDLVQLASSGLQRLLMDRQGRGAFPTETDAMRYLNKDTLAYFRHLYFAPVG